MSFYELGGANDTLNFGGLGGGVGNQFVERFNLTRNGDNLEIDWKFLVGGGGDNIGHATLIDQFSAGDPNHAFEKVSFPTFRFGAQTISGDFSIETGLAVTANGQRIVVGSMLDETLDGGAFTGVAMFHAGAGNDTILANGNNGKHLFYGGTGDDTLRGGGGEDIYSFASGDGNDTISDTGGSADTVVIQTPGDANGFAGLRVYDNQARAGGDLIIEYLGQKVTIEDHFDNTNRSIERVGFNAGTVVSDDPALQAQVEPWGLGLHDGYQLRGHDTVYNVGVADPLLDVDGYRTVSASSGFNLLAGELDTKNRFNGGTGNDLMFGGDQNDIFTGNNGNDLLVGGNGADRFVFNGMGNGTKDTILDYNAGEGDVIDITALLNGLGADESNIGNYVQLSRHSNSSSYQAVTLQVDTTGTGTFAPLAMNFGGANDVVTLSAFTTPGADAVKIMFENAAHQQITTQLTI